MIRSDFRTCTTSATSIASIANSTKGWPGRNTASAGGRSIAASATTGFSRCAPPAWDSGFLPEFCINHPGVVARPVVDPEFWREVNVVTVRGRPHSPAVGALVREAMRTNWMGQKATA